MPANRATRLHNSTCLYCGSTDQPDNPLTVEHVVGRRFVPAGSLDKSWALVGHACNKCNCTKGDLEDEISAITLQPDLGEPHVDATLAAVARRKAAGSFSRRTKRAIEHSYSQHTVEGAILPGLTVKAGLISPPQLDEARVHALAYMHLQGFFYLMSYDEIEKRGGFLPGTVGYVARANRHDWGNELFLAFAALTDTWPQRLNCNCASDFFKMVMKRESEQSALWSFAIEWNKQHRLIGFFGDLDRAQDHLSNFPDLSWKGLDATRRYRREIPIEPENDTLFSGNAE